MEIYDNYVNSYNFYLQISYIYYIINIKKLFSIKQTFQVIRDLNISKMSRSIFSMIQKLTSNVKSCHMAQIAFLQKVALEERCILVDEFDRPIGNASKRDCHRINNNGTIPLHRAFSVFLFNQDNDLLLQKRSPWKV